MSSVEAMIQRAREALERAHAPYSRFRVGACVKTPSGELFCGCNVENASFPEGWCAETSAIAAFVLGTEASPDDGHTGPRCIVEVVVVSDSEEPCAPCGGCRQRLNEFATAETLVHMITRSGRQVTRPLRDLLPQSFDGRYLEPFRLSENEVPKEAPPA